MSLLEGTSRGWICRVACPTCAALVDERCFSDNGQRGDAVHDERVIAFRQGWEFFSSIPASLFRHGVAPFRFHESYKGFRFSATESKLHRTLKMRTAEVACTAGWRVTFECPFPGLRADVAVMSADERRIAVFEIVCSQSNTNTWQWKDRSYKAARLNPTWVVAPHIRTRAKGLRIVRADVLEQAVAVILAKLRPTEAPLPLGELLWSSALRALIDNPYVIEHDDVLYRRLHAAWQAGLRCEDTATRKSVARYLLEARDDATLTRLQVTRGQLQQLLLPANAWLQQHGAGL